MTSTQLPAETVPGAMVWHTSPASAACVELDVDPAGGLSAVQVARRREQYGPNALAGERPEPAWRAFGRQYSDLMQLVLVGAAVVSIIALGDVKTGAVVLGLTVLNALMGLHQEGKAPRRSRPCSRCS